MKNGTAVFHDFLSYLHWVESVGPDGWKKICSTLTKNAYSFYMGGMFPELNNDRDLSGHIREALSAQYTVPNWAGRPQEGTLDAPWPRVLGAIKMLETIHYMNTMMEQPINVRFWFTTEDGSLGGDDEDRAELNALGIFGVAGLYIGNENKLVLVFNPDKYLHFTEKKSYEDVSPAALRASIAAPRDGDSQQLIPTEAEGLTPASVRSALDDENGRLTELEAHLKSVKDGSAPELAELTEAMAKLQRELDEKKTALMAELNRKKDELEEKKYELENQIYLLDSQIYSILCYAGETVKFATVRSGRKAPDTEPIVVYQKLRYLDEDLARMVSLYDIQWGQLPMFESFIRSCPAALDVFAPNERCVMLVRLSKTGTRTDIAQGPCGEIGNMLQNYHYYHGGAIGIIIRNGENLYIGWTDDKRIHITDDLLISKNSVKVEDEKPASEPHFDFPGDEERYRKEQKKKYREERKEVLDGLVSRNFIYQILQGVIDRTPMLPLPKGVTLSRESEYVIYAVADRWLSDTRFGSLTEIIQRVNERITKGDAVLTTQRLRPEAAYGKYSADTPWHNSRGRGERNRTHDTQVEDCTIYPVNLVEFDPPEYNIVYQLMDRVGGKLKPIRYWSTVRDGLDEVTKDDGVTIGEPDEHGEMAITFADDSARLDFCAKNGFSETVVPLNIKVRTNRHVFVSVEKTGGWWKDYKGTSRANFELYDEELINLTYMNSIWLLWAINTKTLGGWHIGGVEVAYAYAIRYLNTAMDFIRAREKKEKALLDAIDQSICLDTEWPLKLTEWKMANNVRDITEYQAKRFAKFCKN